MYVPAVLEVREDGRVLSDRRTVLLSLACFASSPAELLSALELPSVDMLVPTVLLLSAAAQSLQPGRLLLSITQQYSISKGAQA